MLRRELLAVALHVDGAFHGAFLGAGHEGLSTAWWRVASLIASAPPVPAVGGHNVSIPQEQGFEDETVLPRSRPWLLA